jgi:hypothetical protein
MRTITRDWQPERRSKINFARLVDLADRMVVFLAKAALITLWVKNRYRAERTEAGSSGGLAKTGVNLVGIQLMQHIVVCRMKPPVFSGKYTLRFRMLQQKYSSKNPDSDPRLKKQTLKMAPRQWRIAVDSE